MNAILITDGNCGFCQRSAKKLAGIVPTGWVNVPNTELTNNYGLSQDQLEHSVWLIENPESDPVRYSGAKAVGKVLRMQRGFWRGLGWLTFIPPTSWFAAGMYRVVANNRKFFSRFI